ncbi:hypothetical protein EJB05_17945, partial [Eragrostis curvula]
MSHASSAHPPPPSQTTDAKQIAANLEPPSRIAANLEGYRCDRHRGAAPPPRSQTEEPQGTPSRCCRFDPGQRQERKFINVLKLNLCNLCSYSCLQVFSVLSSM